MCQGLTCLEENGTKAKGTRNSFEAERVTLQIEECRHFFICLLDFQDRFLQDFLVQLDSLRFRCGIDVTKDDNLYASAQKNVQGPQYSPLGQ